MSKARIVKAILVMSLVVGLQSKARALVSFTSTTYHTPGFSTYGQGIAKDASGNLYVVGFTRQASFFAPGYTGDIWIAKYNSSLNLLATATFDDRFNSDDNGYGITVDGSGNVYVVGVIQDNPYKLWVAKYNSSLALLSSATVAGPNLSGWAGYGYGVATDGSGNVYVAGMVNTSPSAGGDYWVGKFNSSLVIQSSITYVGTGFDQARAIALDPSGNIYTAGVRFNGFGQEDIYVYKFNSSLTELASKVIGGNALRKDAGLGIAVDSTGNHIYVTGNAEQPVDNQSLYIAHLNSSLVMQNERYISYTSTSYYTLSYINSPESGLGVTVGSDGNVYVAGYVNETSTITSANIWLGKFDSSLATKSTVIINGAGSRKDYATGLVVDNSGTVFVTGFVSQVDGSTDVWLSKHPTMGTPAAPSPSAITATSVNWSWSDVVGEAGYMVVSGIFQQVSGDLPANTVSYAEAGMTPNTLYRRRVKAFDGFDANFSNAAQTRTLAAVPSNPGSTAIAAGSALFFWSPNGNPVGTIYRAERSPDGVSFTQFYSGTASSVTATGLSGTYYFRVRAQNDDGVLSAYSAVADTDHPKTPPIPPVPGTPSVVTVTGRQIKVNGSLFTVKGVNYSPTPAGQSIGTYDWTTDLDTYNTDIPLLKALGINTVRIYKPPTQPAALDALYSNGIYVIITYPINTNINLSDAANRSDLKNDFLGVVNTWKNHPAVLMWCFGNEVDLQPNGQNNPNWYSLLQEVAVAAHAADPNHLVTTAHAATSDTDLNTVGSVAYGSTDAALSALDVWGFTAYRGPTFTTLFTNYAALSAKPMILMEFGSDAFNVTTGFKEDQNIQSNDLFNQWNDIAGNLSAVNASKVCVGALAFEYSDEWWKKTAGDQGAHDKDPDWVASGAYADPYMNEEWFGIVSISPGTNVRNLRKGYTALRTLWGASIPIPQTADILPVYSDLGINGWDVLTWYGAGTNQYWDGKSVDSVPPDGHESFKTHIEGNSLTYAGWGVAYDAARDLSSYQASGSLRFWLKTDTPNIKIEAKRWDESLAFSTVLGSRPEWNSAMLNQWTYWQIPLSGVGNMSSIQLPFMATVANSPGTFYVDKVSYVKSTASPFFNVSIKNRSDNADATNVTWPDTTLPAGWVTANQYLRVDIEPGAQSSWGLQIYTDNKGPLASPAYTGAVGTNPAGLVDTTDPTKVLPLCWRVVDRTTATVTIVQSADNHLYSQELGGEASGLRAFQWMKDKSTPDIPSQNTVAFSNGDDAIMVWDNEGFHYAEGDRSLDPGYWGKFWGAVNTPVYIYLGANFSTATTPHQYKTTALHVELFTQ